MTVLEALENVVITAQDLLNRLDDITSADFSTGGERKERDALRLALDHLVTAEIEELM